MAQEFLTYNGHPLVRCGNVLYYGDTSKKYIVRFTVDGIKKSSDTDLSGPVKVELIYSDIEAHPNDLVIKTITKDGFKQAMEYGDIWLNSYLKK